MSQPCTVSTRYCVANRPHSANRVYHGAFVRNLRRNPRHPRIRGFGISSMQVVHFHERNSGGVVYATHDGGVVTWWKVCDDRRFVRVRWSVAAVPNVLDLVVGDDAADDRLLPVVVRGQSKPRCHCAVPMSDQPKDSERHTG